MEAKTTIHQLCSQGFYLVQKYREEGNAAVLAELDDIAARLTASLEELPEDSILQFINGGLEIGWLFNTVILSGVPRCYGFPYEDLNKYLHGELIYEVSPGIFMGNGALGRGIYLLSCHERRLLKPEEKLFSAIRLQEGLINMVNDIEDLLYDGVHEELMLPPSEQANELLYLALFLARIIDLKIYPEVAGRLLRDILQGRSFEDLSMSPDTFINYLNYPGMQAMGALYITETLCSAGV